ncbi:hypothetical protein D3C72_1349660 [compost metagenome]
MHWRMLIATLQQKTHELSAHALFIDCGLGHCYTKFRNLALLACIQQMQFSGPERHEVCQRATKRFDAVHCLSLLSLVCELSLM